jgi:hypothetical protein
MVTVMTVMFLLIFLWSSWESVPDGYALDNDGNLCIDTTAQEYGEELDDQLEDLSEGPEKLKVAIEYGRGQWCCIANKCYSSSEFWKH